MRPVINRRRRITRNATTMSRTMRGRSWRTNLLQPSRQSCSSEVIFAASGVLAGMNLLSIMTFARDYSNRCEAELPKPGSLAVGPFRIITLIRNFEVIVTSKLIFPVLLLVLMAGAMGVAFSSPQQESGTEGWALQEPISPLGQSAAPQDDARLKMERDMAKKANEERHAALKRDTDKLLRLCTELKTYV